MSASVRDMLDSIAEYVEGSGVSITCPAGRATALKVYNQCIEELMYEDRWEGTRASLRFAARQGVFWTPSCVQNIVNATIDKRPALIRPDTWQFIQNGPGGRCSGGIELRDLGDGYATGVDLAEPLQLAAWSDHIEEDTAWIHFTDHCAGFGSGQMPGMIQQEGERLHLLCGVGTAAQPAQTTSHKWVLGPKSITKPVTRGNVYVAGVKAGHPPIWLASLRPTETSANYRRYQILDTKRETQEVAILADCDLRFVKAVFDDEVSLIQNPAALRLTTQAFAFRDAGNDDKYEAYKGMAMSKLNKQIEKLMGGQTIRPVFDIQRSGAAIRQIGRNGGVGRFRRPFP